MNLLEKAHTFAKKKHDETGKLYNGEPYFVHPLQVYQVLLGVRPADEALLCAGFLHDVLEDTPTTFIELCEEFTTEIATLVYEVTKDTLGNFPNLKTERGLLLKTADRLANVSQYEHNKDLGKREKLFKKYSHCFIYEGSHRDL